MSYTYKDNTDEVLSAQLERMIVTAEEVSHGKRNRR